MYKAELEGVQRGDGEELHRPYAFDVPVQGFCSNMLLSKVHGMVKNVLQSLHGKSSACAIPQARDPLQPLSLHKVCSITLQASPLRETERSSRGYLHNAAELSMLARKIGQLMAWKDTQATRPDTCN